MMSLQNLPYTKFGLSESEAIAHAVSKLTFGPTEDLIQKVQAEGLENWLESQLSEPTSQNFENEVAKRFPITKLSVKEIAETYPSPAISLILMGIKFRKDKQFKKELEEKLEVNDMLAAINTSVAQVDRRALYELEGGAFLKKYFDKLEFGNFMELMYQLRAQKLYRAVHSPNQIQETLADFWFNHLNVSTTRVNDTAPYVLSYDRDVIRANVLGHFPKMLKASAHHPAMLIYLDNNHSNAAENAQTLDKRKPPSKKLLESEFRQFLQMPGINENYARELLELHTLGVDGGYTQNDVEELSRILSGWKVNPLLIKFHWLLTFFIKQGIKKNKKSFLKEAFFFDSTHHDAGTKTFLGRRFMQRGGYQQGVEAIETLAAHPATANFISTKLVKRFVSDDAPKSLVDIVAKAYTDSAGHIPSMIRAMLQAEEFWDPKHRLSKVKTPFEYVASALRSSKAQMNSEQEALRWIVRMGEPIYGYQVPTGFPDNQTYWTSGTGLINRLKFATALAENKITGIRVPDEFRTNSWKQELSSPKFQKQ
ncbi:MAG: DUF1800 domain-containing protein [Bacteroidota bacterium]